MPEVRARKRDSELSSRPAGTLFALGRLVGFALFAGLALGLLAAVVLVPAYARLAQAQYERDCLAADVADSKALALARDRMIEAMPYDRVATKDYMAWYCGLTPAGELVLLDPAAEDVCPTEMITFKRHARPAPPSGRLLRIAGRLERPRFRRGLCLLAAMSLTLAFFLFSSPQKYVGLRRAAG